MLAGYVAVTVAAAIACAFAAVLSLRPGPILPGRGRCPHPGTRHPAVRLGQLGRVLRTSHGRTGDGPGLPRSLVKAPTAHSRETTRTWTTATRRPRSGANRRGRLVARVVEGGFQELVPVRGLGVPGRCRSGGWVEFTQDGRLVTQAGEFTRTA